MVSLRCKLAVNHELNKLGLLHKAVMLGTVEIIGKISAEQHEQLKTNLLFSGLEIMDNNRSILVERIQNVIVEMIYDTGDLPTLNLSHFISQKLNYDYTYLANLFAKNKGISITHFIIKQRIERVKELILYGELNLTEIAYKLHYSSVGHLSNQFKKITGLTPSLYKIQNHKRVINLEDV